MKLWEIFAAQEDHDADGMIALIPSVASAAPFVVPGGEPLDELHVTVQYLSEEALPSFDPVTLKSLCDELTGHGPLQARVMGHATFNPDGGPNGDMDPCAVYLVSDSPEMERLATIIRQRVPVPEAHAPWLAHMTAGYGMVAGDLRAVGPIVFDRLRLAIGPEVMDFPL